MIQTSNVRTDKAKTVVFAALIAMLCFGLAACQPSPEQVIRDGVTKEFESLKNLDQATLDEFLGGVEDEADLAQFGIDSDDFFRTWLDGFDYTVDDVSVDGNNATVTATITCKSLADAFNTWSEGLESLSDQAEGMSEDELYQLVGTSLMEAVADAPTKTSTVELPYVLNGNTWEPGPGYESALSQGFVGDM